MASYEVNSDIMKNESSPGVFIFFSDSLKWISKPVCVVGRVQIRFAELVSWSLIDKERLGEPPLPLPISERFTGSITNHPSAVLPVSGLHILLLLFSLFYLYFVQRPFVVEKAFFSSEVLNLFLRSWNVRNKSQWSQSVNVIAVKVEITGM